MQIINQNIPFFLFDVKEHLIIKPLILEDIKSMGLHSLIDNKGLQKISNTDWHLSPQKERPYWSKVAQPFDFIIRELEKQFYVDNSINAKFTIANYWFQQYNYEDYHAWHNHGQSSWSCVYYVELPTDSVKTSFKLFEKEFSIDVKEGQLLIFPGIYMHDSKPNTSKNIKTIISFNIRT